MQTRPLSATLAPLRLEKSSTTRGCLCMAIGAIFAPLASTITVAHLELAEVANISATLPVPITEWNADMLED